MGMMVRYTGAFYSRKGVVWRCRILQESDVAFPVRNLEFPDDEPLMIEYNETAKENVICGSTATLTIVSPGDRTYLDLYSIKVGQIRLDVYRNNVLFWSGCLDPEFYEEPYDSTSDYEVSLTFSDFGILDRMPYDGSGRKTLKALLDNALDKSRLNYTSINESLISTQFADGTQLALSSLMIASENFYDEDGEASSFKDVIEGIFQPLGLRMIQRAGKVYVYDINGLYTSKNPSSEIDWQGEDSSLGTDSVYNNIKITFSPYSTADVLDGELDYEDVFGPEWTNLTSDSSGVKYNNGIVPTGMSVPTCYSYYIDYDESHRHGYDWDYALIDYTLFQSWNRDKCKGVAEIGSDNSFFKIQPMLGGNETEGVVGGFYTGGHGSLASGFPTRKGLHPSSHPKTLAMKMARVYLPEMGSADAANNYLRIQQELLFDPRYNPFSDSGDGNESGNHDFVKNNAAFAFVPVAIVVYDEAGTALCHYSNEWLTKNGQPGNGFVSTAEDKYLSKWGWKSGEAEWGEAWLAYYDPDDVLQGTGVMGWQCNHQSVGKPWTDGSKKVKNRKYHYADKYTGDTKDFWMFDSFKKLPDGQFIPYPPKGGYLEIRIYNGVWAFDDVDRFSVEADGYFKDKGGYDKIRWQLYKLPKVSVVKRTLTLDEDTMDDVEYSGVLNADAKEDLELDTICGTADVVCPTAKGIYMSSETGEQIQKLMRAGRTDHPEHLLIGTLYSQYADRRTTLSGEVSIDPKGLSSYVDAAQGQDVKFIMSGEEINVKEDVSDATFIEMRPDEYEGKEG